MQGMEPAEDDLRLLWRHADVLLALLDDDGRFVAVNPAWTALLGWTEAQLLGHRIQEFMVSEDVAGDAPRFTRVDGRRSAREVELRVRHADGSIRWLQWTADQHESGWYVAGRDVTARRTTQRALQRSERRSRAILTALREGLVVIGPDRRILEVNDRFAEMTGWSARDIVGIGPPFPWWPPGPDGELAADALQAALRGDGSSHELTFVRRDGGAFRALVDDAPLVEDPGARPGTLSVVRDISELTDARDRLREAHDVARLCSWEWFDDGDRVVITYDGMRPEMPPAYEVTGDRVVSVLGAEDRERARRLRDETAAGMRAEFVAEFRVDHPSIDVARVEWRGRPLRDAAGRLVGVRGTAQDVSRRDVTSDVAPASEA